MTGSLSGEERGMGALTHASMNKYALVAIETRLGAKRECYQVSEKCTHTDERWS